jgi:hypothetical protein
MNGRGCFTGKLLINNRGGQGVEQISAPRHFQFQRTAIVDDPAQGGALAAQVVNRLFPVITKAAY